MNENLCERRSNCRLCESEDLELAIRLAATPPANAFVSDDKVNVKQNIFPLEVFICMNCSHVQLLDVIDPRHLFEDYVYVSGTSPVFIRHFEEYATTILDRMSDNIAGKLVVDIGSNDGTLLEEFKNRGLRVLGIDPARSIAAEASARGIETKVAFFTSRLAQDIKESMGPAQIVCANNVFAHADDLIDLTKGVRTLLAPDGLFIFEVSYLVDVLQKTLFDTIYHEHYSYLTAHSVKHIAHSHGLELFHVDQLQTHGGSNRYWLSRSHQADETVAKVLAQEINDGLFDPNLWQDFAKRANTSIDRL